LACLRFWWRSLIERDGLEFLGLDGSLKVIVGFNVVGLGGVEYICLTQDKEMWWAVVNTAMNLLVVRVLTIFQVA
jgi:hypothetical protein